MVVLAVAVDIPERKLRRHRIQKATNSETLHKHNRRHRHTERLSERKKRRSECACIKIELLFFVQELLCAVRRLLHTYTGIAKECISCENSGYFPQFRIFYHRTTFIHNPLFSTLTRSLFVRLHNKCVAAPPETQHSHKTDRLKDTLNESDFAGSIFFQLCIAVCLFRLICKYTMPVSLVLQSANQCTNEQIRTNKVVSAE